MADDVAEAVCQTSPGDLEQLVADLQGPQYVTF